MSTALRIANWIALAFFGFATVVMALAQPVGSIPGALNMLPFGLALLAARKDSAKLAVWAGIFVNGLWSVVCIGVVGIVLAGWGGMPIAVPICLLLATPCVFNTQELWLQARG